MIFESWLIAVNVRLKFYEFAVFSGAALHRKGAAKTPCKCGSLAGFLNKRKFGNKETIRRGLRKARKYYGNHPEFQFYSLKLCRQIADVDHIWEDPDTFHRATRDDIISDGYVVHSLEAAIWCLYTTNNYRDCVLKAVNLGEDTDTVAAIAGGLAGALYGYDDIPKKWLDTLYRRDYIEEMCERAFRAW